MIAWICVWLLCLNGGTLQPAPATAPTSTAPAASAPSGASSSARLATAVTERVTLPAGADQPPAVYWLRRPAGHGPGQRPALLLCLHGTDDTAEQMISFWAARKASLPLLLAAPQGRGRGWSDVDLPTIRAMMEDLGRRFPYDEDRVMLAGFSAGGAMTFEMLYKERLPAAAAAALANYVPPRITQADVAAQRLVPVFYAVGMTDVNHERMRGGLEFLRTAGANVELYRPRIGHTLDAEVAQRALDFLLERCRRQLQARLDAAAREPDMVLALSQLEAIVEQQPWHEPDLVRQAAALLDQRESSGRVDLRTAQTLQHAGRSVEALALLRKVEAAYGSGRLGREATAARQAMEAADPTASAELARRQVERRAAEAMSLYASAQRLVAQQRLTEAAGQCRRIIVLYGDTPAAERARNLLKLLQPGSKP